MQIKYPCRVDSEQFVNAVNTCHYSKFESIHKRENSVCLKRVAIWIWTVCFQPSSQRIYVCTNAIIHALNYRIKKAFPDYLFQYWEKPFYVCIMKWSELQLWFHWFLNPSLHSSGTHYPPVIPRETQMDHVDDDFVNKNILVYFILQCSIENIYASNKNINFLSE